MIRFGSVRSRALAGMLLAAALLAGMAPAVRAADPSVSVRVADADWGDVETRDVTALLELVADVVVRDIGYRGGALRIVVAPTTPHPMTLFTRTHDGAYQILLAARDRNWGSYVYEFAHELGHVLTNYGRHHVHGSRAPHQWFEEALCEVVSLHALEEVAARWSELPASAALANGHEQLIAFRSRAASETHRHVASTSGAEHWLRAQEPKLRINPYDRMGTERAAALMLPIFASRSGSLRALRYLNAPARAVPADFDAYLHEWCEATPPPYREVVDGIINLFGIAPAPVPSPHATLAEQHAY